MKGMRFVDVELLIKAPRKVRNSNLLFIEMVDFVPFP